MSYAPLAACTTNQIRWNRFTKAQPDITGNIHPLNTWTLWHNTINAPIGTWDHEAFADREQRQPDISQNAVVNLQGLRHRGTPRADGFEPTPLRRIPLDFNTATRRAHQDRRLKRTLKALRLHRCPTKFFRVQINL
jgi:hypothetical protein